MPMWLMFVPGIIQGIAALFHKDDPANPQLNVTQAPAMFMQQMMPMMLMMSMSKDNEDSSNLMPMLMMMQMMGVNPTASINTGQNMMQEYLTQMVEMQTQMVQLKQMMDQLSNGFSPSPSPK